MADSFGLPQKALVALIHTKIPALVVVYNIRTGRYTYVNDALSTILGYTKEAFLKGGIAFATTLVHPDDLPVIAKQNAQALKEANSKKGRHLIHESPVTFEYRMRHKDNSWRWLHSDGVVFDRDEKGKVLHVMNVSVDITKRKESELAQSEQRLKAERILQVRLYQESVVTELGIAALSGKPLQDVFGEATQKIHQVLGVDYVSILEFLPSEKKMLFKSGIGWRKEVVVDKTVVDAGKGSHAGYTLLAKKPIVIKDVAAEKRFHIAAPLATHPAKSGISCVILGKETPYGVITAHSKTHRKFTNEDITFLQSIANLIALTIERKQLETQKDEFIGIASHELKTPVTSIKAYTQVLESRFAKQGDEKSVLLLSKMNIQIDRLTNLITDLLDVTKIQKGQLAFQQSYFDFNELVGEIVEQMQRVSEKHRLVMKLGRSKTVRADRERIGQVLINFISNAIKYSPQAKKIIIKTWVEKDMMAASVQDFGIGIAKDKTMQVFERFYREKDPQKVSFPGLGLGLYIASQIIKRHSGKIWVESEKNKGSTFVFCIPLDMTQ